MTPLDLIECGFQLFPCNGKVPLTKHGVKDACDGRLVIQRWAEIYPGCNWGVATGEPSGVVVVDVDKVDGEPVYRTVRRMYERGMDGRCLVRTPSGGLHYYFQYQDGLSNKVRLLGEPIDVRTTGGYVIFPVDNHNGNRQDGYQLVNWEWDFPRLPDWVAEAAKRRVGISHAENRRFSNSSLPADKMRASKPGQRNHDLFKLACWCYRGGGSITALAAAAAEVGLPDWEIQRTIESAERSSTDG